jgi:hypothetical protein
MIERYRSIGFLLIRSRDLISLCAVDDGGFASIDSFFALRALFSRTLSFSKLNF